MYACTLYIDIEKLLNKFVTSESNVKTFSNTDSFKLFFSLSIYIIQFCLGISIFLSFKKYDAILSYSSKAFFFCSPKYVTADHLLGDKRVRFWVTVVIDWIIIFY